MDIQSVIVLIATFLVKALLAVAIAFVFIGQASFRASKRTSGIDNDSIAATTRSAIYYGIATIGFYVAFVIVGVKISFLTGVIALGLGAIFQRIGADFGALFGLALNPEFKVGDRIEYREPIYDPFKVKLTPVKYYHVVGKIYEITRRYVVLKTIENRKVIIPNGNLLKNILCIYDHQFIFSFDIGNKEFETEKQIHTKVTDSLQNLAKLIDLDKIRVLISFEGAMPLYKVLVPVDREKLHKHHIPFLRFQAEVSKHLYKTV